MARWLLGAEVLKLTLAWCQVSWWVCWMSALRLRPLLRSLGRAEWSLGAGRSLVETAGVCRSRSDICSYRGMRGSEWRNLGTGRCFFALSQSPSCANLAVQQMDQKDHNEKQAQPAAQCDPTLGWAVCKVITTSYIPVIYHITGFIRWGIYIRYRCPFPTVWWMRKDGYGPTEQALCKPRSMSPGAGPSMLWTRTRSSAIFDPQVICRSRTKPRFH
jgi:hypothetical protein